MSAAAELLPSNSTAFERAVADGMTDVLPVPIKQVLDPAEAPVAFLPFLAAHESVDLWFDDWSVARKRAMIAEAPVLARKKGTRAGTIRFLSYVDGVLLDVVSYPARFVLGRAIIGRSPLKQFAFLARHLVKIETQTPPRAVVMGRAVLGRHILKTPSREPFRRAMAAMRTAKAPETEYRVDFAYRRPLLLGDAPLLNGARKLGDYVARNRL